MLPPQALMHQDDHVDDYVRGRMSPRKRAVMESHLARCPRCRDLVSGCRRRLRRTSSRPGEVLNSLVDAGADTAPNELVTRPRRMVSNSVPVVGSLLTLLAFVAVVVAAWHAGGEDSDATRAPVEEFTASGVELSAAQVSELRKAGWTCADLRPLGLKAGRSTGYKEGGVNTVTTSYKGNGHTVLVTESRRSDGSMVTPSLEAAGLSSRQSKSSASTGVAADSSPRAKDLLGTAENTRTVTVSGADGGAYKVYSSLGSKDTDGLVKRLKDLSDDRMEDAKARVASGWERLSRGWARLVEPAR